jgi:transcription elongation factor Elf1
MNFLCPDCNITDVDVDDVKLGDPDDLSYVTYMGYCRTCEAEVEIEVHIEQLEIVNSYSTAIYLVEED